MFRKRNIDFEIDLNQVLSAHAFRFYSFRTSSSDLGIIWDLQNSLLSYEGESYFLKAFPTFCVLVALLKSIPMDCLSYCKMKSFPFEVLLCFSPELVSRTLSRDFSPIVVSFSSPVSFVISAFSSRSSYLLCL